MRQLSTSWTWFYKLPFPVLWVGFTGFAVAEDFKTYPDAAHNWLTAAIVLYSWFYVFHLAKHIKHVSLDRETLIISDYGKEIRLPLQDVERVWVERSWNSPVGGRKAYIEPRLPTPFGHRIEFVPKAQTLSGRRILEQELTDLVRKAKGLEP